MGSDFFYQVGGALPTQAPCYIERNADHQLLQALKAGEYCYIFDSRQMGKSSLLVRSRSRLEKEGCRCVWLDLSIIGSENITPERWYLGIASELWLQFDLFGAVHLVSWWQEQETLSPVQKLRAILEQVVLPHYPQQALIIFIDEVDSILALDFPVTDFFALIRFCYNQRAINRNYQRLTFALFGVAVPGDLINDPKRTPFNIGRSIALTGFQWQEVQPLLTGFQGWQNPKTIIKAVLQQTGGQPFLTQKLCKLLTTVDPDMVSAGEEQAGVETIARSRLIERWESQDEPEHLRTIADRLLRNSERVGRILGIYQRLLAGEPIASDNSREQIDLILSGLLVREAGTLKIRNPIYRAVFNEDWVARQLAQLRPYAENLQAWETSNYQDTSRLLRGQALIDAQTWAQGKSLSDLDYEFLSASQTVDRQELQLKLDAERAQAAQTALHQQKRVNRWQRFALGGISLALIFVAGLGAIAYSQYRRAVVSNIRSLVSASEGLFASERRLDALLAAIQAAVQAQGANLDPSLATDLDRAFQTAIFGIDEFNRLLHDGEALDVAFCPRVGRRPSRRHRCLATVSVEGNVKLWQPNGTLITTLPMEVTTFSVDISPDGRSLVAVDLLGNLALWNIEDLNAVQQEWMIKAHQDPIWKVRWSPDNQTIATASSDTEVKLFSRSGELLQTFTEPNNPLWSVDFNSTGELVAGSMSREATVFIWERSGKLLHQFSVHPGGAWDIKFHPLRQEIISADAQGTISFWQLDGTLLKTIPAHEGEVWGVALSDDGKKIASVSLDGAVKIWQEDGALLRSFLGHQAGGRSVAWRDDESAIASVSADGTARLWRSESEFLTRNYDHQGTIWEINFSPDGKWVTTEAELPRLWKREGNALTQPLRLTEDYGRSIQFTPDGQSILTTNNKKEITVFGLDGSVQATIGPLFASSFILLADPDGKEILSGSEDGTIERWGMDGTFRDILEGQESRVWRLAYSPNRQFFASASQDGTVWVRDRAGEVLQIWEGHERGVWGVAISPDSEMIASASQDGTVQLWTPGGDLLHKLEGKHNQRFSTVDINPDGKMIAAGGVDGTVTLWSSQGQYLTTLYGHRASVMEVSFSPDGLHLASGGDGTTLILWNLDKVMNLNPLDYACSWLKDYLETLDNNQREALSVCHNFSSH